MSDWKRYLKADPVDWLLEENNPSVRFFTLRDILDKPADNRQVREAREQIMSAGPVPQILSKQNEGGYWGQPQDFYVRSKYRGTVWSFILLSELGADGRDKRLQQTCEFILNNSQDIQSGGFAYRRSKIAGGEHNAVIPCLTGNMLRGLVRLGYLEDPRVRRGIDWILAYLRCDDGADKAPEGWPYDKFKQCWGQHTCHMGVIALLKALAEIPSEKRQPAVKTAIEKAADYFLLHHIHKKSHDLTQISKPEWTHLGFPHMWESDVLDVLGVLTGLGYQDERMQEAIDLVVAKQDSEGKWLLENSFNGRFLVSIEHKGRPSKWVTLKALTAIKRYYEG